MSSKATSKQKEQGLCLLGVVSDLAPWHPRVGREVLPTPLAVWVPAA